MTYRIPKQIKAGPFTYTVVASTLELPHAGRFAETSHVEMQIRISPSSMKGGNLPVSLLHELIHIADVISDSKLKETQVQAVGHVLAAILQDLDLYPREMTLDADSHS